jgi:hypothetical protein
MVADLQTMTIRSATLTATNNGTHVPHADLMLGVTSDPNVGNRTWKPNSRTTTFAMHLESFRFGQTKTFRIPASIITQFVTGGATAFVLGDDKTKWRDRYGWWKGTQGSWTLVVNYEN